MHPTTEILCLAYNLKDGSGKRLWVPGMPEPVDLFWHLAQGGLIEAHNSMFEYLIWTYVATRIGWPTLALNQLRCSAAKARAYSYPGALGKVSAVVGVSLKDTATGRRVITRYCIPRNPTKNDPRTRILPTDELKGVDLFEYCLQDIESESSVSLACPDLSESELKIWLLDQQINARGICIDVDAVSRINTVFRSALIYHDSRIANITGGAVEGATKVTDMKKWLAGLNVHMDDMDEDAIDAMLEFQIPPQAKEVLEGRKAAAGAGAKKLTALMNRTCSDGRMRDAFNYYRAHTGRWSSEGLQLQNMKASGPDMQKSSCCGHYFPEGDLIFCPFCTIADTLGEPEEWGLGSMEDAIWMMSNYPFENMLHYYGGHLIGIIGACIRGLIIAPPGKKLMCSDYTAIEAVVLAVLANCVWRIELFKTHGKIYEKTASDITGVPFGEILEYKLRTGSSHPHRKPFGKVPELASGYQGWIGAWKAFGADKHMDEETIKKSILAWRAASPEIVELWGGQWKRVHPKKWEFKQEYYGLEGMAIQAVLNPGMWFTYGYISYGVLNNVLYCRLPSGRCLSYHEPELKQADDRFSGKPIYSLSHMIQNSNPKKGKIGWIRVNTYGGMLTENATQGVARDLLAHGMQNLTDAGYHIVGHVHDEIITEEDLDFGSVEEFERLMTTLPDWAQGWPIKADGGWEGQRYRKD
jgi:DNA polymerase